VTSKSNLKFAKYLPFIVDYPIMVDEPPRTVWVEDRKAQYWALGGGSVIDTAKMLSGRKPCIAIPTTASGSACTSWAVVWGRDKMSVSCTKPILLELYRKMDIKLSAKVADETYYDCLCHILDSRKSIKATPLSLSYCQIAEEYLHAWISSRKTHYLIDAGNYAGRAIEITGTNFYHAISYVLTLDYGLSHGEALKEALNMNKKYDWNKIIEKAKKYDKFHEVGV